MIFEKEDERILSLLLAATYKLRNSLSVSNNVNNRQPNFQHYYIATVLDQMLSLETTMLRWQEDLVIDKDIEIDNLMCCITQASYNEVQMYRRKNIETLAKLILFQNTNIEEYYRHYILINQYTLINRISKDFRDFYSITPNHISYNINELKKDLKNNEKNISLDQCWFKRKDKDEECSFKRILLQAIPYANKYEKILLGLTYHEYSSASENIHSNVNLSSFDLEGIENKCKVELLRSMMIVNKCQDLLNQYPDKANRDLKTYIESLSEDNIWIKPLFENIYKRNDYVCTVDGSLARITNEINSKVGYKSYQVKYLDSNNFPREYGEYGEYPAHNLRRFHSRSQLHEILINAASPVLKTLFTEHMSEEDETKGFDELMILWWQNGYKEKVLYGDNSKFEITKKIMGNHYNNVEIKDAIEKLVEQKIICKETP